MNNSPAEAMPGLRGDLIVRDHFATAPWGLASFWRTLCKSIFEDKLRISSFQLLKCCQKSDTLPATRCIPDFQSSAVSWSTRMDEPNPHLTLRARIADHQRLLGTFVKISGPSSIEILAGAGFDFVVIDQEHGVFDRAATDLALLACKASGVSGIVRVPALAPDGILSALDCGAAGILAPHIDSAGRAKELVAACRYRGGRRGFSAVTRAGGYGAKPMWKHVGEADAGVAAIAMIEDPAGVDNIDDILSVEGLDAVFIGRGDLTVAYGAGSRDHPTIVSAVDRIIDAVRRAGKSVWMMVETGPDIEPLATKGVSSFIVSSDQGMLRNAARDMMGGLSWFARDKRGSL
ncbi:2-keto-3-deoxy-L-rhamnonate aldolase RhmA [Rhizobium lusitanum]|uniref:2-keto-3-deoxy-L-rhamnonate aldolase RhmA n=2 Tax=Rhizobium lusitanum TaxID=293958 RepID=A0A7X0IXF1_9HYPH|nr:2-keto-3-deoxy-L-rhamnonate aldolase RhmA [Rhizobium lusitanum]